MRCVPPTCSQSVQQGAALAEFSVELASILKANSLQSLLPTSLDVFWCIIRVEDVLGWNPCTAYCLLTDGRLRLACTERTRIELVLEVLGKLIVFMHVSDVDRIGVRERHKPKPFR